MTLSSRERHVVLIGLVAVIMYLVVQHLLFPFIDEQRDIKAKIVMKSSLLRQYEARLTTLPALQDEVAELRRNLAVAEQGLIEADTPAVGAANVQLILDTLSKRQTGLTIKSTRVLDPTISEPYVKIAVRISITAKTKQLMDFVYDVEHQPETLWVSEFSVRVPNPKQPRDLRADLVIEALMKQPSNQHQDRVPRQDDKSRRATA